MALSKGKKRTIASLVITLAIIVLFITLYQIPQVRAIYETLELKMLDLRFILEPQPPRSEKIVHIDVDDATIKKLGWPCPRQYYAYLIDILSECGSQAIIFDILFLDPGQPIVGKKMILSKFKNEIKDRLHEAEEDTAAISNEVLKGASPKDIAQCLSQLKDAMNERCLILQKKLDETVLDPDELIAASIGKGRNVFLPFVFPVEKPRNMAVPEDEASFMENFSLTYAEPSPQGKDALYKSDFLSPPIDIFSKNITGSGFVNAGAMDRDGVMRRIPLVWEYKGKIFSQLTFSGFLNLIGGPGREIEIVPGKYIKIRGIHEFQEIPEREITIPTDKKMQMIIHWAGEWKKDFPHKSFHAIVELKEIRDIIEESFIILDDKYTYGRLRTLKRELESNPAPPPQLLKEIDEAKKDICDFLERRSNIQTPGIEEIKEHFELLSSQLQKEKRSKERITRLVKGKICFIGLAGTATHDRRPIPIQPDYPMVGLHSNILNTIITQNFIKEASLPINLTIFLLTGLLIAGITPRFSPWKGMSLSIILLGLFICLGQHLFQKNGLAINMVGPMGLIIASYTAITSYRYITEEKEKIWVKKAFSHYLSPKVMNEILADPGKLALGGKRQELTVLFSDIRSFTTYCEKRSPEEIIPILNEYLDVMSNVIFKYNGTLDKYVGDAIVAFFGAPQTKIPMNHAEMAVRTALDMIEELKKLQEKWKQEGKEPLDFGVGINTGPMMVGNMGSTNRLDYTVIGDEVNLGARVEALTRDFNVRAIITQSTYEKVKELVEIKSLGEVKVKGKAQLVKIYELLSVTPQK